MPGSTCPHCSLPGVVPIVYGLPGQGLQARAQRGEVVLGGCVVFPDQPTHACRGCDLRFERRGEMTLERHPFAYEYRRRFPRPRQIGEWEGGAAFTAEKEGGYYVIIDEGTLADFTLPADADLPSQLVNILRFDSKQARDAYVGAQPWSRRPTTLL